MQRSTKEVQNEYCSLTGTQEVQDEYCSLTGTQVECRVKLSNYNEGAKVYIIVSKSVVGSLRYLTHTRLDILYIIGLVS